MTESHRGYHPNQRIITGTSALPVPQVLTPEGASQMDISQINAFSRRKPTVNELLIRALSRHLAEGMNFTKSQGRSGYQTLQVMIAHLESQDRINFPNRQPLTPEEITKYLTTLKRP